MANILLGGAGVDGPGFGTARLVDRDGNPIVNPPEYTEVPHVRYQHQDYPRMLFLKLGEGGHDNRVVNSPEEESAAREIGWVGCDEKDLPSPPPVDLADSTTVIDIKGMDKDALARYADYMFGMRLDKRQSLANLLQIVHKRIEGLH